MAEFGAVDELFTALSAYATLASECKGTRTSPERIQAKKEANPTRCGGSISAPTPASQQLEDPSRIIRATRPSAFLDPSFSYDRWVLKNDRFVDYGYLSQTRGQGIEQTTHASEHFYITTAINYTNGPAHMGHAYEATTSDVIARYHRLLGEKTYFLTGTDEHGQKIANTADDMGKQPIEICDLYVSGFQVLNQRMLISNDDYVRTTSDRHKRTAKELWNKCANAGDIYLDTYSGWYNVKEETYVTDSEAALLEFKDPTSGQPLKRVEEASYFFRMSKYRDRLLSHIQAHPEFIQPDAHRNQIVSRLEMDDLRDLSISRTTFSWGIPVPDGFDEKHVMYVWIDALTNYLTGVNGLGVNEDAIHSDLSKFWPANVHIIGKDILWFHTVIWPCLLMSACLPLPLTIFAHGFVNDKEGKKMSKSLGNVVDPHDMLDKFHVDTFRWYLCKESPYGGELAFSEDNVRDMHNADLCDTLGNLVHRATNLCSKYCNGFVPDVPAPETPVVNLSALLSAYTDKMSKFELQGGAVVAIQGFRDVNGFLQEAAPWAMQGEGCDLSRQVIVRAALEAIYALAHLLLPFIPVGASIVFQKLGTEPIGLKELNPNCRNLVIGTSISIGQVLYTKCLSDLEIADVQKVSSKNMMKESLAEAQARKKETKTKNAAKASEGQGKDKENNADQADFTKIDIRVGKITKVWYHPDADKLFCEEIDVGEETGPRAIASGLRHFYSLEDMQDRRVLVVCNLKPCKIVGFESQGMVLAAKSDDGSQVELVAPPTGSLIGERVMIKELSGEPYSSTQVKKKKVWEAVASRLRTTEGGIATWDGKALETSAGTCSVPTLVGAPIM